MAVGWRLPAIAPPAPISGRCSSPGWAMRCGSCTSDWATAVSRPGRRICIGRWWPGCGPRPRPGPSSGSSPCSATSSATGYDGAATGPVAAPAALMPPPMGGPRGLRRCWDGCSSAIRGGSPLCWITSMAPLPFCRRSIPAAVISHADHSPTPGPCGLPLAPFSHESPSRSSLRPEAGPWSPRSGQQPGRQPLRRCQAALEPGGRRRTLRGTRSLRGKRSTRSTPTYGSWRSHRTHGASALHLATSFPRAIRSWPQRLRARPFRPCLRPPGDACGGTSAQHRTFSRRPRALP